jgi:hypothetical protein
MPMVTFLQKYSDLVKGVLSGFDRLVFQGTLMPLCSAGGMADYLFSVKVLLKDLAAHVLEVSTRLREASCAEARRLGRPVVYLPSSKQSKEDTARQIAEQDGVREGLIAVLTCVEPIWSYRVASDRVLRKRRLQAAQRKGLQLYHYWMDPDFGLMHGRISTWFPFQIRACLNGREWLARKLDRSGIRYGRHENGFTWIDDTVRAQQMMDEMLQLNWPQMLDRIAHALNPAHGEIFRSFHAGYYWTVAASEWATDMMFDKRESIDRIYPLLTRGAMECFGAENVLRFLGRKPHPSFLGEVYSDHRRREEGVRVKHQVKSNSVKMYDKGTILRTETTINDPRDFKVYRSTERQPNGEKRWLPMRKGVADLHRRAQVSEASNQRYLEALATLDTDSSLLQLVHPVCRPTRYNRRPVRALQPWSDPDRTLLQAINDGAFCLNGFRNRDIVGRLHPKGFSTPDEHRKASAQVTRLLRLLRAHGIIKRVSKTYRYQVTDRGRQILTAILQYQALTLKQVRLAAA